MTAYVELHCKTNFSFLEGASHAEELVQRAVELEYSALAITDRNSLAGIVRAHGAAKDAGLKLVVGAEITPVDAPAVVLWATDRAAYGRLARLITRGRRNAPKGKCHLTFDDVAQYAEGLLAGVIPPAPEKATPKRAAAPKGTETQRGTIQFTRAAENNFPVAEVARLWPDRRKRNPGKFAYETPAPGDRLGNSDAEAVFIENDPARFSAYREVFGPRCSLLAELHYGTDDRQKLDQLLQLSRTTRLPLLAAGHVHYHTPQRRPLHDVLVATRLGGTVHEVRGSLFANTEYHLKAPDEMARLFAAVPQAVRRTLEIAGECTFSLDELRYEYPEELVPRGTTPIDYLARLTWQGAGRRYPEGIPDKVHGLIEHELRLIRELRYEAYFLTVWDLVRFARRQGILCQGRGSAANSAVCYCLGITSVDPARLDLLFERFVSRERNEAPDIDVDFEHERREEVLQYIYNKYGRERVGMTAEVITYRPRSAVRDVGKALGYRLDEVDCLAKSLEGRGEEDLAKRFADVGFDTTSRKAQQLLILTEQLCGFPRHLSQHVGGMVMTHGPLCELVPIENAAMADRTVIQWNKDDLDELGILKVDCLALGMLTAIHKCFDFVREQTGRKLTLANIPPEDPRVYDMICAADTVGVFQIESRGQMSMLPRLRPRRFYDLVIEVAIVRPGPIQGNMVHPFLRRRMGQEEVTYPNDEIREVLKKTLGVPLFQEQAMRLAIVAAGFTPGEADQLRRAMGAWRRPGVIDQFRERLLTGMREHGLSEQFAENVYRQIRGFGEYGFPESHAASFALLVYVSAWLKYHHPAAFTAALLNSQPMGFYAPAQLVRDAREHGVEVRPADVNASQWDCTLESSAAKCSLRLGLRMIGGLPKAAADVIVEKRTKKGTKKGGTKKGTGTFCRNGPKGAAHKKYPSPFSSLQDFSDRTGLSRAVIVRLSRADAFHSLGLDRQNALWNALAQEATHRELPLFSQTGDEDDRCALLPELSCAEEVFADYQTTGLSLRAHPVSFYRKQLEALEIVRNSELPVLPANRPVRVAGLVLVRQRPSTAKGITFVTLEDETGTANLVVRIDVWERFYEVARKAPALIAHGRLERKQGVIHVVVHRLEDLSQRLADLNSRSRDFC